MADDPNGKGEADEPEDQGLKPADPVEAEEGALLGEEQESDARSADDGGKKGNGGSRGLLRHLTVNEWLTFFVGLGTLVVSGLTYMNAADTRDIKAAIGNLSALATQAQRQADASQRQVALLTDQLQAAKRQAGSTGSLAEAAGRSADAAAGQLAEIRDEKRPWITVGEPTILPQNGGDIRFDQRWIRAQFTASGQRPAFNVVIRSRLVDDSRVVAATQRKLCDAPKALSNVTMFPGQRRQVNVENVAISHLAQISGAVSFYGSLVGCVIYADDAGKRHRTGFAYDLRSLADDPNIPGPIHTDDYAVAPSIMLIPNPAGMGLAD